MDIAYLGNIILCLLTRLSFVNSSAIFREIVTVNTGHYFKSLNQTVMDLNQILAQYQTNECSHCKSRIECTFICLRESSCKFYVWDESKEKCFMLDIPGVGNSDNVLVVCPPAYTYYGHTATKFCMLMVKRALTRNSATSNCQLRGGRVAVLIEDDKHNIAGQLAKIEYEKSHKLVWIDAMMNTEEKKWYWSDGTLVAESRFNQKSANFVNRPTSHPFVAFLSTKYFLMGSSSTGYAMCEASMTPL